MNAKKLATLCAALFAASLAGCANDDDVATSADLPPAATEPADTLPPAGTDTLPAGGEGTITVANYEEDGGTYLADSAGNSVYMLEDDVDGTVCVGDCLAAWPPVLVTDMQPTIATGVDLDPALLGTVQRADGTMQVTYAGHPLYRYAADTAANRTAGHGIQDQWGHWYLVTPTGAEFEMDMDASASLDTDVEADDRADAAQAEDGASDGMPADGTPTEEDAGDDY